MRILTISIVALTALTIAACSSEHESTESVTALTALTGVSVIDLDTGAIAAGQTIVIRDHRIEYVGSEPPGNLMSRANVLDHAGRFVIPGLWDMHIHLRGPLEPGESLAAENAVWLRQYLGFGVTTVRDAGGDLSDEVLRWRDEIASGQRKGPRIFTSLRKLDGPEGGWPGSIRISGPDDIGPALDTLEQQGADFIKLYDGSIVGAHYLAAIAEAERRGLRTAAHVPLTVAFEDAIEAGLDSVEHADYLPKAASGEDRRISAEVAQAIANKEPISYFGTLARFAGSVDPEKTNRVFDRMIERGAAITPTLHISRTLDGMTDVSVFDDDAQLAEVPAAIRATYDFRATRAVARSPEAVAQALARSDATWALLKAAADRGVTILAGSDTGAVNSYVYPGDSLHAELGRLVDAGLTPLQALKAATVDAAAWMGQSDRFGTIASGKAADLVILEDNPLTDIRNTRSLVAVMQDGVYLDEDDLSDLRRLPE